MSGQQAFLDSFEAAAFGAFFGAGLADAATYTGPATDADPTPAAMPCQVLVDRDVEQFGDDLAPVSVRTTVVAFRRAQVEPVTGATVAIGAEAFTLLRRIRQDESLSRWEVERA